MSTRALVLALVVTVAATRTGTAASAAATGTATAAAAAGTATTVPPRPRGVSPRRQAAPARLEDGVIRIPLPVEYLPIAVETAFEVKTLPMGDQPAAVALADLVARSSPVREPDLAAAELLFSRQRSIGVCRRLLRAVHLRAAEQARAAYQLPAVLVHLRRVATIAPEPAIDTDIVVVLLEQGRWAEAEGEAEALVAQRPDDVGGHLALAFARLRQDRAADALPPVQAALVLEDSKRVRLLLALVERALASEQGLNEARHWHFHVLYEGAPNPDLGRALTERLESHYSTLVGLFEYEPGQTIPVILFTKARYYAVTGAPHWSGGAYNALDGRIRVPVGGLTTAALGEIDGTLLHELTHVFVAQRTGGAAPRFLHEALAQYVEGDRVVAKLDLDAMSALTDGRLEGVGGFYAEALSFAEYLMQQAGQRGINDVLADMGETGSVDASFRRVYGRDYEGTRTAWREWARTSYR